MCGETTDLQPSSADEYVLDTPTVRSFVAGVQEAISGADGPAEDVESIRPIFSGLLAEEGWLPEEYQVPAPESGMGGGIGQWLLFLSAARDEHRRYLPRLVRRGARHRRRCLSAVLGTGVFVVRRHRA